LARESENRYFAFYCAPKQRKVEQERLVSGGRHYVLVATDVEHVADEDGSYEKMLAERGLHRYENYPMVRHLR
jgi:hypothetical protein